MMSLWSRASILAWRLDMEALSSFCSLLYQLTAAQEYSPLLAVWAEKRNSKKSAKFIFKTYFFEISPPVYLVSPSACEISCPNRNIGTLSCVLTCFWKYIIQRFSMCRTIVKYGVRSPKFIWAPGYSCTHWLRPRYSPLPPKLGSYTRALCVIQDRQHLFVIPYSEQETLLTAFCANMCTMYSTYLGRKKMCADFANR